MYSCMQSNIYIIKPWKRRFVLDERLRQKINKAGQTEIAQRYDLLLPEKLQLGFLKSVMGVHKSDNDNAVRLEFGIFL